MFIKTAMNLFLGAPPLQPTEAIEVLCKIRAFVVKRTVPGVAKPDKGQVTWSKFSTPEDAWVEAKKRAGLGGA